MLPEPLRSADRAKRRSVEQPFNFRMSAARKLRLLGSSSLRQTTILKVESRKGAGRGPTGSRWFPFPAHQTGRADFPHPAFGQISPRAHGRGPRCTSRNRSTPTSRIQVHPSREWCRGRTPCVGAGERTERRCKRTGRRRVLPKVSRISKDIGPTTPLRPWNVPGHLARRNSIRRRN
jgi:hypothetical protein